MPLHHSSNGGGIKRDTTKFDYSWLRQLVWDRLYKTQTRPARTQSRLLSSFAIQIEHEAERGKPSTAFEAARLFLVMRDKILVIWIHGADRVRHGDHSTVCVRQTTEEGKEACVSARNFYREWVNLESATTSYKNDIFILQFFRNHGFCLVHSSPNFKSTVDWR